MNALNVLIVDDHPQWVCIASTILRPVTSRIQVAATWAEALLKIEKPNGFDVVMLDLGLPDSPAQNTLERINTIKRSGRKVVLVTGCWPPGTAITPENCNADGVLYKGDVNMAEKLVAFCQ
jgi:CheY-like chemotaxis protein